jgi:hypothetical protein
MASLDYPIPWLGAAASATPRISRPSTACAPGSPAARRPRGAARRRSG